MDRPLGDDEIRGRARKRIAVAAGAGLAVVADRKSVV
jgi:hypothetical protein